MSDVVLTFSRREQRQRAPDQRGDLVEAARPDGPEKRLQFREGLFDRIEIRTVRRQKPEMRAGTLDGRADVGVFVHGEVVEDDDIPGPQRGHEHLLDVGAKARGVDRPIEHGGRRQRLGAQGGDDGLRVPMTARGVVVEAGPTRTPAVAAQQVGGYAALVQKDVATGVVQGQPLPPVATLRRDVRPSLFVGVYGFF